MYVFTNSTVTNYISALYFVEINNHIKKYQVIPV